MRAFISYSHKDEAFRLELDKHLALLKRQQLIEVWSDHCVRPGQHVDQAINDALETADLVLLLVSSDFMHSEYCFGIEMTRAVERASQGRTIVVPIIVRPCDWNSAPFGRLRALPTDGRAVAKWPSLDDAFLDVVQQLRVLLSNTSRPAAKSVLTHEIETPDLSVVELALPAQMPRSSNLSIPKVFTDEDRHDFLVNCYQYIEKYFEGSLRELQARNKGVSSRLVAISQRAFTAVVFRDGKRQAGCHIRLGSGFGAENIAYSASENGQENSFNELLMVESDKHLMFFKATMAMFHGDTSQRLTEEGAAEHLWTLFMSQLQH